MVDDPAPVAGPEEQKDPKPWVGNRAASGRGLLGQPAHRGVLVMGQAGVSAAPTRSVRPTEP